MPITITLDPLTEMTRTRRTTAALAVTLVVGLGLGAVPAAADAVHPVTVVVTNPEPGKSQATTEAEVRAQFDGMAGYWRDQSGGLVDFQLADFRWWPAGPDCGANSTAALNAAEAFVGFQPGRQKHVMLIVPSCNGPSGSATSTSGITRGGRVHLERYDWRGFWSHELGHNLGFGHAGVLVCPGGAVDGELTDDGGSCREEQYADAYDTMGSSPMGRYKGFSTPKAIAAGFISESDYVDINATGRDETVTISTRDRFTGVRSAQITDPLTGRKYWIEMATDEGYSAGLGSSTETYGGVSYRRDYGVRVLRTDDGAGTWLLAAPPVSGERTLFWPAGSTFVPPSGGIEARVVSTTSTTATLRIRTLAAFGAQPFAPGAGVAVPASAPTPAPAPRPAAPRVPPARSVLLPAKLKVTRAEVRRDAARLSLLAPISSRAAGAIRARFRAAGRTITFTAPVDASKGHVRVEHQLPAAVARRGSGILTLAYDGDGDTQAQIVRLRAAPNAADLKAGPPQIISGRVQASGTVHARARGIVRLQLVYQPRGAAIRTLTFKARIERGSYRFDEALPADVLAGIAARQGFVHSYVLFTGYNPARMRGELASFRVRRIR